LHGLPHTPTLAATIAQAKGQLLQNAEVELAVKMRLVSFSFLLAKPLVPFGMKVDWLHSPSFSSYFFYLVRRTE
jgi:hypothetical protein